MVQSRDEKTRLHLPGFQGKLPFSLPIRKYLQRKSLKQPEKKDIYVRYFDKPRINNYLRITIGTDEEMEKFLKFLTSFLKIQK